MSPEGTRQLQELCLSKRNTIQSMLWSTKVLLIGSCPAYSYVMTAAIMQSLTDHFPCFLPLCYIVLTHSPKVRTPKDMLTQIQ
jgi:hypothetical protein